MLDLRLNRLNALVLASALLAVACGVRTEEPADLVILGGRVVDPETGLDAVRHVAVRGGTISAVSERPMAGRDTIPAAGLVVVPGFIDLHQHAQDSASYTVLVRGGITSALDLENGTGEVAAWYAERAGRSAVHHGVAIGLLDVRARLFGDTSSSPLPSGPGAHRPASDSEVVAIRNAVSAGLDQGAVGVGILLGYTPAARPWEILEVFRAAAAKGAAAYVHVRSLDEPLWYLEVSELIGAAAATGGSAHLVHVNSSMEKDAPKVLEMLRGARARGVDITTEAYPYTVAMTEISSAPFDDWRNWLDERLQRLEWVETGERLSRSTFGRYRAQGGLIAMYPRDTAAAEGWLRGTLADTLVMIASDGVLEGGKGHPRAAGTHARVLGRYVREDSVMSLMSAVRRMTLDPARRLEPRVPAMQRKGRVQVGADADLVVFDPLRVRDEATFREPTKPSAGIPHVVVGGELVVRGGNLTGRVPGQAIRAERNLVR